MKYLITSRLGKEISLSGKVLDLSDHQVIDLIIKYGRAEIIDNPPERSGCERILDFQNDHDYCIICHN